MSPDPTRAYIKVSYPGGIVKTFAVPIFEETWEGNLSAGGGMGLAVMVDHKIFGGYYLSELQTPHASLSYAYETVETKTDPFTQSDFTHLFRETADPTTFDASVTTHYSGSRQLRRLTKISNNTGKSLSFGYEESTSTYAGADKKYIVTSINTKDVNGNDTKVRYTIDANGLLTAVKRGQLPETRYSYWNYQKTFNMYFIPIIHLGKSYRELILPE